MHNHFLLKVLFFVVVVLFAWLADIAHCEILVANNTGNTLRVFLKGTQDAKYRGPYKVDPRSTTAIPISPGTYYVATARADGKFDYLGWQDYSRHRIAYDIVACAACKLREVEGGKQVAETLTTEQIRVHVSHADGEYVCPNCGKKHTRWTPGWGGEPDVDRDGTIDDHGVKHPNFEAYGPFRLGVSVIDADGGVMVTRCDERSPAQQMRRTDKKDAVAYQIAPGINIVTHVNGRRVRNTTEFAHALAVSDDRSELTILNTELRRVRDYWTILRN